ncbi:MAG: TerB family tellurite resistance protein [Bdellovibrionales bacterium]|jgi:uncharacterized tellurite resistance protein B-like protein|nr:TerB family tellurite resistance protein [Bdellovibrionales bacterium]MBT3526736.1 TerB family tellurite resistance protein [Bdellovibrionales bacterium]MBT7668815.1 TerB family tellurite resistance protein [Bdellovibrionales bacterium]
MNFWTIFKTNKDKSDQHHQMTSSLQKKISTLLNGMPDDELIKIACIAGLSARVVGSDMVIEDGEIQSMKEALKKWGELPAQKADAAVQLAMEDSKELAGIENHKYCSPLIDLMTADERYHLLESLFAIAAGDGSVVNAESEEIRLISKGLMLGHNHFVSARATVLQHLESLKK